jgi:TetR/AcrR family transcriptional regulator
MDQDATPRRREREKIRHRQEILDAARKICAARGLEGITVESVAREADFAVGSVYRHFRSKEELIELLVVDLAQPLFDELEVLPGSGIPFADQLEALVRVAHRHFSEDLPVLQAFFAAPGGFPATEARNRLREARGRYFAAIDAVLAVGQAEGRLPPGDRVLMTVALAGMVSSFAKWGMWGNVPLETDPARFIRTLFLDGCGR